MKMTAKPLAAAIVLVAIIAVPACGGPKAPPTAAVGSTRAASGTTTSGGNAQQTPEVPATSTTAGPGTAAPATTNVVQLGVAFFAEPVIKVGNIPVGQSVTVAFGVSNRTNDPIRVESISTDPGGTFSASRDCDETTVEPGGSCAFSVRFAPPPHPGSYSAQLLVKATQGPGGNVRLEGSAGPPTSPGDVVGSPPSQLAPDGSAPP
jgi:hypothetical protein